MESQWVQCGSASTSATKKMVSPSISCTGLMPTVASFLSGLHADAGNRGHQATAQEIAAALCQRCRQPADAVDRDEQHEGHRKPRQQRRTRAGGLGGVALAQTHLHHLEHDHRHQHRHAHQLDEGGDVAGLLRQALALAGADHLRHVMDGRAEVQLAQPVAATSKGRAG
jgi:hypothetical protein